jgi:hypothetical protein
VTLHAFRRVRSAHHSSEIRDKPRSHQSLQRVRRTHPTVLQFRKQHQRQNLSDKDFVSLSLCLRGFAELRTSFASFHSVFVVNNLSGVTL